MNKHISKETLGDFFQEIGEKEEVDLLTQKKLVSAKVEEVMAERGLSKSGLAQRPKPSGYS